MIFTGEGPNRCLCGVDLPGTSHWSDEALPATTCPSCGLDYVLEAGQVLIYEAGDDFGPDLIDPALDDEIARYDAHYDYRGAA